VTVTAGLGLPDAVLNSTSRWLAQFAAEWHSDIPMRIHSRETDRGGTPAYTHDFARWLTRSDIPDAGSYRRNPESRMRVTRAFRALRKIAPREYEVLYRVMVLGESLRGCTEWLNARAIKGGHPERYVIKDTICIIVSGIDKMQHWY
jgi:hypothetical protein